MTKWELVRYLIDAKKCVDSIIFIEQNLESLKNINVREKVSAKQREFYINCCVILDKASPKKKKDLCKEDEIVQRLYYERDKNFAHKDSDYKPITYNTVGEIADDMRKQIIHIRELCKDKLPSVVSLDFVPHDRELFRLINGITAEREIEIEREKYPQRQETDASEAGKSVKIFHDTEEIRDVGNAETHNMVTVFENGINEYEGVQNRQDSCIRTNVLFGIDMWCSINVNVFQAVEELMKLGFIDKYGIPRPESLSDPTILKEVDKILSIIEGDK